MTSSSQAPAPQSPALQVRTLLRAVAKGDRGALEQLYRLSSPKLYGVALRILRRPDAASDALRAAFLRVWHEAGEVPPHIDPVGWLVGLARESALHIARTTEDTGASWEPFEATDPAEDPLARDSHSEELRRLLACLGTLSEERRRMVLLAYYDGWSREALSVYFDASEQTIQTWMKRSVQEIDEFLGR